MSRRAPHRGAASRAAGASLRTGIALLAVLGVLAGAAPAAAEVLYVWSDENGVVRYTPDPDRVPGSRRHTMLRVERGTATPAVPEAAAPPAPLPAAARAAPAVPGMAPDPFNAPGPDVQVQDLGASRPGPSAPGAVASATPSGAAALPGGAGSASLDARIAELEAAIARDERALKDLISEAPMDGGDALVDSPELREIARRLPALQEDLRALRERRDGTAN